MAKKDLKKEGVKISIAIIPFIVLLILGFWAGEITLHQKVFKTFLIFIFDIVLLLFLPYVFYYKKEGLNKSRKYIFYFLLYFIFILFQYIVSFVSKEVSYDRDYYLANYTFLIILSLCFYLYLNDFDELKLGLILISIFFVLAFIGSVYDFINTWITMTINKIDPNITDSLGWKDKINKLNEALKTTKMIPIADALKSARPKLSFGNTNYFAGYIIGLLPLLFITPFIFYKKESKSIWNKLYLILLVLTCILGLIPLFLTQTIAAWFGFYVGVFLIFLPISMTFIKKIAYKFRVLLLSGIMVLFIIIPLILMFNANLLAKKFVPRLAYKISNLNFTLKDRFNGWEGGIGLFKDHPLCGAGLGTIYPASFKYTNKYFFMYSQSNSFKHSHGEYIEVLGEGGIIGILSFFCLFGFILFFLIKKALSDKYDIKYRFMCLGVSAGLVSMLVHQIFSLSLRMSVTMAAYFSLIGLGIFLISYHKKAVIINNNMEEKEFNNKIINYFNKFISKNESYLILLVLIVFLITSFLLFKPLFKSERNIIKYYDYLKVKEYDKSTDALNIAIESKPDNVYAWNIKYNIDNNSLIYYMKDIKTDNYEIIEALLFNVKNDIDKLNSIIPAYQEVWAKFAEYFTKRYYYFNNKFQYTKDLDDYKEMTYCKKQVVKFLEKHINCNFLFADSHIKLLVFLSLFNNKDQYAKALKDYIIAKIYLDFAKPNSIIKENIQIKFDNSNSDMKLIDKIYYFTISNDDVVKIIDNCFDLSSLNEYDYIKNNINMNVDNLLKGLYSKK